MTNKSTDNNCTMSAMNDLLDRLDRLNKQDTITTGFKLQCINTMLKFIKDDTRMDIEYVNLTAPQAELITALISHPNVNSDIGFGFKSFYAPLWEALREYGSKYEFKVHNLNNFSTLIHLVLEKIPKDKKVDDKTKVIPMDTSESELDNSTGGIVRIEKKDKHKTESILKSISPEFVAQSLKKIIEFYTDDTLASVTFNKLKKNEAYFLEYFKNILNSNRSIACFCKSSRIMLENIKKIAETKTNYKLCVKKARMCNLDDVAITFNKIPVFAKPAATSTHHSATNLINKKENVVRGASINRSVINNKGSATNLISKKETVVRGVSIDRSVIKNKGNIQVRVTSDRKTFKDRLNMVRSNSASVDRPVEPKTSQSSKENVPWKITETDNKKNCSENGGSIDKTAAVVSHVSTTDNTPERGRPREKVQNNQGINNRKEKLLEAMSVPLKSDKALKMMRDMGWEGGALGLRGDGITEPLVPALHLVAKAGLGHIKPDKPTNNTKTLPEFRQKLFQSILDLITSDATSKVITYPTKLVKKEESFINQAIQQLSGRSRLELTGDGLVLVDNIVATLRKTPDVFLNAVVSKDKRELCINKTRENNTKYNREMHRRECIQHKLRGTKAADIPPNLIAFGGHNDKNFKFIIFKIDILVLLLEFVKNNVKFNLECECVLSKKTIIFVTNVVEAVNRRRKFGANEAETLLCLEIMTHVKNYDLSVEFPTKSSIFIIRKIFFNQQTTVAQNSTLNNNLNDSVNLNNIKLNGVQENSKKIETGHIDNPPAKSQKDREGGMRSERDDNSCSDDVIIVEGKESPFVLSDDEDNLLKSNEDDSNQTDTTSFKVNVSLDNCDNYEFENDLRNLEEAILAADEIKIEDSSLCAKRSHCESPSEDTNLNKKQKPETKRVYIVHNNYPNDLLNKEQVQLIQKAISDYILTTKNFLPLLKCHGVQDGALVYSCHTENSYNWLQKAFCDASDFKILDSKELTEQCYKMSLRFNCYFNFDVSYLFSMLKFYNKALSTDKWVVIKNNIFMDHVCFVVEMDGNSYNYVRNSGFCLYAGVDQVQFSIICD